MALLLVRGTRLELRPAKVPLNKKFIFSLGVLYLLAIHLPWPVFSLVDRSTNVVMPTNLITWMACSLVISIGLFQTVRHQYLRYSKLTVGLFVCCLLLTLPLAFSSPQINEVMPRIIGLWGGLLFFILLQQFLFNSRHKQRIIWFIVLAGWIEAIKNYLLLAHPSLSKITDDFSLISTVTTFHSSTAIATFLATSAIASGYLLARHPSKYGQLSIVALLYITPFTMLPLIYIHSPIIATTATILGGGMIIPYLYRFASYKRLTGWIISFVSAGGLILILSTFHILKIVNHEWLQFPQFQTSIIQSANMLVEKPFTGYGYGKFDEEYVIYSARQHQLNANFPAALPEHRHPNNEPLLWTVEGGLLPLFAIILAALLVATRIYSAKSGTRLASFALLLPITLQAQFSPIFYLSSIHWVTFIILLFWVDQRVARYKPHQLLHWQKKTIRLFALLIPLLALAIIGAILHDQHRLSKYKLLAEENQLRQLFLPNIWRDELKEFALIRQLQQNTTLATSINAATDIEWLLDKIRLHPRPYYYQLLIQLYTQIGENNRAEQTLTEANFLFPTVKFESLSGENNVQPDI